MTAHTPLPDPQLTDAPDDIVYLPVDSDAIHPSPRTEGWTAERQRRFLEAIADGTTVGAAAHYVRLSRQSAYAFRRTAAGQAFSLGWDAANLREREHVAERLMNRAVDGQEVTITRADGSTHVRHHYDNRLALALLTRLDRYADAMEPEKGERPRPGHAARLVAAEFDAYLDAIGDEGGPARAGRFLLDRAAGSDALDLEPVVALARADRFLRTGAALAAHVDAADLDPAARHAWTADQWRRAEAAGLVRLAPEPPADTLHNCQSCQPGPGPDGAAGDAEGRGSVAAELDAPVYWNRWDDDWRTTFPPADDFYGQEWGTVGDEDYERELSEAERELVEAPDEADRDARVARGAIERDAWFADLRRELRRAGIPVSGAFDDDDDQPDASALVEAGATDAPHGTNPALRTFDPGTDSPPVE